MPNPLEGPGFGSFLGEDVTWLLTDLSDKAIEISVDLRESRIQNGTSHYSENLPVEYVPSRDYEELFNELLSEQSLSTALHVGVLAERILQLKSGHPVLVSLARAGTPIGVLLKRWMRSYHEIEAFHYSISIIRDKGIDQEALKYILDRHDPKDIIFVDGWTGKGVITEELSLSIRGINVPGLSSDLAVVSDPGSTSTIYGTREDILLASACLNSTVCGLVSRTVHSPTLTPPGVFHGAKFYEGLRSVDRTDDFLSSVERKFEDVRERVNEIVCVQAIMPATWRGRAYVTNLGRRLKIQDFNLIKPGVGESTRVLLRRVPWQIRLKDVASPQVRHIVQLANERGVKVIEDPDSPYAAVGIIKPTT